MKNIPCLLSLVSCLLSFGSFGAFNYRDRVDASFAGKDVTMRFELHATAEGGVAPLASTNLTVHVSSNGVFCAEVGVPQGRSVEVFSTTNDRYIAVWAPDGKGGLSLLHGCRRKLMPVPTAIYAQDAGAAPDGFVVRGGAWLNKVVFVDGARDSAIDADGHVAVTNLSAGIVSADNGTVGGSLSVGNDLLMTKSFSMAEGTQMTGSNVTLIARNVAVKSLTVAGLSDSLVPKGLIMMWYGEANNVPEGWAICDGNNGTPDLTGRFVVGATRTADQWNTYLGRGGARGVTLGAAQIPKHGHSYFGDDQLVVHAEKDHDHSGYDAHSEKSGDSAWFRTAEAGGGKAHENRPPFKAVYYIMKVK